MKIESTDQDIRTLLSSSYYKIPRFQRPYSWDRENVQEFWDDSIKGNDSGDYFIGSMVVYEDSKQHLGVVDGQQRLTTITILLCVLRDTFSENGFEDLASGVHGLIERKNIDNKAEFILSTESSYPYFQDHIQSWGKPGVREIKPLDEELNLQRAYDQLKKLVNGLVASINSNTSISEEGKKKELEQNLKKIRDQILDLKLIRIQLDNEDDAYLIFETLNTRGKDLSVTDLVKNHLTKLLKNDSVSIDPVKLNWEEVLKTIESSSARINTDTFIHHLWLSKYEYLPIKRLFKELKKKINTREQAEEFLENLVIDSKLYRSIYEPKYRSWTKEEFGVAESLHAFLLFNIQQQIPCVLSLLRAYQSGHLNKRMLENALRSIERFHFSFTAVTSQRSSGGIAQMYASSARRISESENKEEIVRLIRELQGKLRRRVPSIEEFKALFPEIIYTNKFTKQRSLVKYILKEFHRNRNKSFSVDYEQMSIEHLLSQSSINDNNITHEIVGQLGNLILIPQKLNEKLADKPFSEKKKILVDEGVILPEEVRIANDWEESEIVARTRSMAETSYNTLWQV